MNMRLFYLLVDAAAVIVGLVLHECSHALVAYVLGDKTARSRGRVSLNPMSHIDPFGTVILPLIMLAAGGPVFAFAKPVPVYLNNLAHPKRDEVLVSFAGPACNVLLVVVAAGAFRLFCGVAAPTLIYGSAVYYAAVATSTFITVNLSLAFFNLIPLPPLDGSSILVPFLRGRALQTYYRIQPYAMPILILVLYLLPQVTGIDLIGAYFGVTVYPLGDALLAWALNGL